MIPSDLVNVFDERELELLIGGIADIDVEDWKKHTDYRGYQEQDEVIQNFWKVIRTWDAEQKSRLLQFATGTSRIPVNGFKDLQGSDGPRRFTIEKAGEINALPKSHTWYVLSSFSSLLISPRNKVRHEACFHVFLREQNFTLTNIFFFSSFNRLDLPPYKDYQSLNSKLSTAVEETLGFGQE